MDEEYDYVVLGTGLKVREIAKESQFASGIFVLNNWITRIIFFIHQRRSKGIHFHNSTFTLSLLYSRYLKLYLFNILFTFQVRISGVFIEGFLIDVTWFMLTWTSYSGVFAFLDLELLWFMFEILWKCITYLRKSGS